MTDMPQLTFTRFIAAFLIVIYHFGARTAPFDSSTANHWLGLAPAGVSYFFLLSGFILTFVYDKGSANQIDKKKYYLARLARIYPLYILALAALVIFLLLTKQAIDPKALFLQATLLQAWFPSFSIRLNIPSWSLSVEVFFYLLFPFLLVLLRRIKKNWQLIMLGSIIWFFSLEIYCYGLNIFSKATPDFFFYLFNYNPLLHLNSFVLGIISCLLFKRFKKPFSAAWSLTLILAPLIIIAALIIGYNPILHYYNDGLLAPLFAVSLIGLAGDRTIISKIFSAKPFVLLGEISYGIYLLQVPIYAWWDAVFNRWLWQYPSLKFYGFVALLIFAAWLSFRFVERPIRQYVKKYNDQLPPLLNN
jgi:peptidoglycan/LPS O-acetylase OafA/YrhL